MKQFFKNKFFYIMTVLALLFTIVPTIFYSMGLTFVFRDAVCMLLTPMQKVFNYATEALDGFAAYFYKFDELVEENNALRERIAELEKQNYDAAELEERSAWMSSFLEMKTQHTDFKMLSASVTGRESGNYSKILTIDVGTGAGVQLNMPVVTSEGIVGQITELGYNWAKVTTIVEAQSAVGAYIERTDEAGICEGAFELSADGLCRLSYLPAEADVKVGDRVLSTGFGSVYPRGLVIGYVETVGINEFTRSPDVTVKCAADFSELTQVMIITDYEIYVE
ncbi:MAG: rod shape-determining protein MreC [Clostridia bacterium]|nr:rod shape-determining protein MreC [Clostridia bacterium]MBQ7313977.1 rod shape-determining protein MreC [Clostridia bacterium]